MKIAICVATCRRPQLLQRLLVSLANLEQPVGCELEVRVVDNDPEHSAAPVLDAAGQGWFPWRLLAVHEPQPNVARARNRALDLGPADLYAFVDDDEEAARDWLCELVVALARSSADAAFGPVLWRVPEHAPGWLRELPRVQAPAGPIDWSMARTGNALVNGRWFNGGRFRFDEGFGRSGGEDTDLFARLARAGARLVGAPRAKVAEDVGAERLSLLWHLRRAWRGAINHGRLQRRHGQGAPGPGRIAGRAAKGLGLSLAALPAVLGGQESGQLVAGLLCLARAGGGAELILRGERGLSFGPYGSANSSQRVAA